MKKFIVSMFLFVLSVGDASYFFSGNGCGNARWDGWDKKIYGNWISSEGCGRTWTCQQGVGIDPSDSGAFKNGLKTLYRNNTGNAMVLSNECEVIR